MPKIEVSVGELLDKFSILEIKVSLLEVPLQILNVKKEISYLSESVNPYLEHPDVNSLYAKLKAVNVEIWRGMDQVFAIGDTHSANYERLCRRVTKLNQDRSYLKKQIDIDTNSNLTEEKSYF